jgi:hypothetical protein
MSNLPFSRELYFWVTVGTIETVGAITVTLFVGSDVLFSAWAARGGDVDFFSGISSIFPSGA